MRSIKRCLDAATMDAIGYGAPTFTPITGPGMDVVTWRSGDLSKTYLE